MEKHSLKEDACRQLAGSCSGNSTVLKSVSKAGLARDYFLLFSYILSVFLHPESAVVF